eukprot:gene15376-20729_t
MGVINGAPLTFALISLLPCIASIVLVCFWATNRNSSTPGKSDYGFLGELKYSTNPFAWHPVLMTAGFFCSQSIAIVSWNFSSNHDFAKLIHVIFQIGSLVTLIIGLCAVIKYKWDNNSVSLVTMHSWIGIAAFGFFCLNFSFGSMMAALTACWPNSFIRKKFDLLRIHRHIGMISYGLSAIAVVTGIINQLPTSSCYYNISSGESYSKDTNPADHYVEIPLSCRIANGLGLTVTATAILVALTVVTRNSFYRTNNNNNHVVLTPTAPTLVPVAPDNDYEHSNNKAV